VQKQKERVLPFESTCEVGVGVLFYF